MNISGHVHRVYKYTRIYSVSQHCIVQRTCITTLYTGIHGCTWVYMHMVVHRYTWLYKGIHGCTWLYTGIHGYTPVYVGVHRYTRYTHAWVYIIIATKYMGMHCAVTGILLV